MFDRRNHNYISVLLKVIEEFIFNSDYAPDGPADGFGHCADEGEGAKLFHEFGGVRIFDCEKIYYPPKSKDDVYEHARVVEA